MLSAKKVKSDRLVALNAYVLRTYQMNEPGTTEPDTGEYAAQLSQPDAGARTQKT